MSNKYDNKPIKVVITEADKRDKKFKAVFRDKNNNTKTLYFGAKGMSDFTIHKDPKRKERYLKRHKPRENWSKPDNPGSLSRWILWNKPSYNKSLQDFKKRFKLS